MNSKNAYANATVIVSAAASLLLAACGSAQNGATSGPGFGVIPAVTGTPAPVSIVASDAYGNPLNGAAIIFSDPEGRRIADTVTDTAGLAAAQIPAGGIVSLVKDGGANHEIHSVAGVVPGMAIHFGDEAEAGALTPGGIVDVTLPGPRAGAVQYDVYAGCAEIDTFDAGSPVSLPLTSACDPSHITLLTVARDSSWAPVAWSSQELAMNGAGEVAATMPSWRADFEAVTMTLLNAPAETSSVQTSLGVARNGLRYADWSNAATGLEAGDSTAFVYLVPAGFGDAFVFDVWTGFAQGASSILERRLTGRTRSISVDLSAELLPRISIDTVELQHGKISWSAAAPILSGAIRIDASWMAAANTWSWSMLSKSSFATHAEMVDLPVGLSDAYPAAGAALSYIGVMAFDASFATDYGAIAVSPELLPNAPNAPYTLRISTAGPWG